jgi:hydrogenase maturation protease
MQARVLVAGIGNIFLGDDAFGVEVIKRLATARVPEEARVVDFGIRGLDLAYALLDGYEAAILVDAAPRGETPGTLYLIEPDMATITGHEESSLTDAHSMDPVKVLRLVASMGGTVRRLVIVGCEPEAVREEDFCNGMSAAVSAAVDRAVVLIESLVARLLRGEEVEANGFPNIGEEVETCRH